MKKNWKKIFSAFLIFSICLSICVPISAYAQTTDEATAIQSTEKETENLASDNAPEGYTPRNSFLKTKKNAAQRSEEEGNRVLLVEDVLPWNSDANQVVLSELTEYDKVTTSEFLSIDLSKYSVIVFANDQPFSTYENYKDFKEYMELFASIGGVIVFGACDAGWSDGNLVEKLPGNVSKMTHYVVNNYIVDDMHPIVTGSLIDNFALSDYDLQSKYCSHVSFDEDSLPAGSKIILRESESDRPTLVEYPLGKGRVIASGLTWEHNWYYGGSSISGVTVGYFAETAMADMFQYAIRVSSIDVNDIHLLKEYYMRENAHYVVVSDKNSNTIEGASVTVDGKIYTTDKNGIAMLEETFGVKEIKISASGYRDNQQYYDIKPRESRIVFMDEEKNDGRPYATMVSDTVTYYDLRNQTKRYEEGDGTVLTLRARANWGGASGGKYVLYQEGEAGGAAGKSVTSLDGNFSFAPGKVLNPEQQVKLKLIANTGKESEPINLNIVIDKAMQSENGESEEKGLENVTSFKIAKDQKGSVNDSKAKTIFPGDFSLKISSLPLKISKTVEEDGSITWKGTIGIGKSNYLDSDAQWDTFKKDFDHLKEMEGRTNKLSELIKGFGAKSGSFTVEKKLLNPKIESVGYIEIKQDKNGNIIESDGGVIVSGSNTSTLSKQFLAGPIPIYIDLTGKVQIDLQFGLGYDFVKEGWIYDGEIGVSGEIALGGGLGVSGVATVGVEGSAELGIKILPKSQGDITLAAKIKAYLIFVFDWEYPIAKKTFKLWGYDDKKSSALSEDADDITGDISFASRDYTEKTSAWKGKAAEKRSLDDNPESFLTLQEYILPTTLPEFVKIGDTYMMLFQADDATRTEGNNIVLMYSVYDNDADIWMEPKAVCEGESSDLFAKAVVQDDELYVIWQKVNSELVSEDADALLDEMTSKIDISFAKWDKDAECFEQVYVNTDNRMDMYPCLAINDKTITAVWASNSENDATGSTGTYAVKTSEFKDGAWSKPTTVFETTDYITELSAGYVQNNLEIVYAVNSEEASANIYRISKNGSDLISGQTAVGSALSFRDGYFYWAESGTILQYNAGNQKLTSIRSGEESVIMPSYRIVKNKTDTAAVWIANTVEGGSEVYASVKSKEGWSAPVVLLEDQGYRIQYMDVEFEDNGSWKFVFNTRETVDGEEKSSIVYACADARADTALNYVDIDKEERVNEKQPVLINLSNNGQNAIDKVFVRITDMNGNTYFDEAVKCALLPGESKTITVEIDLADVTGYSELRIKAYADNEWNFENNEVTEAVGLVDVSLELSQYTAANSLILAATVTNHSDIPSNTAISIVEDSKDGIVLDMKNIGVLTKEDSYVYLYSIDKDAIEFNGADHKYYYVIIDTLEKDVNEYDNTEIISVYPTKEVQPSDEPIEEVKIINATGITAPKNEEIIFLGDIVTKKLTATVLPENATNRDVRWTSDNEDVAIVNQNGVVSAIALGTANITATTCDGNYSSTIVVNVVSEHQPNDVDVLANFIDVRGHWAEESIRFVVENGLFNGTSETTFEPETAMTRAMLVTVLWRYQGSPKDYSNSFTDVKTGEWYADAVSWASSNSIVNGIGGGKFDPEGIVTREQMATILYRYSEWSGFDTGARTSFSSFPDANKVSAWAKDAMQWAVAENLIGGSNEGGKTYILPSDGATRAQVATILMRFIQNIAEK